MDFLDVLFPNAPWRAAMRQPSQRQQREQQPERSWDDPPTGSVIGEVVGRTAAAESTRDRTVIFNPMRADGPSEFSDQDFAQAEGMARWQRGAADDLRRLALGMRYRPQLPTYADDETRAAFPFSPPVSAERPASRAARATGVPVSYIGALTGHESGDDENAEAPTSSATGHGQFIDDTWLRMMRTYGPRYGLDASQVAKADLLALRRDPQWSAIMIGEYAQENAPVMRRALGRELSEGEVYLGHFLGAEGAVPLIQAVDRDRRRERGRQTIGRDVVSRGAFLSNMPIFYTPDADVRLEGPPGNRRFVYHGGGRLRTATEVYEAQTRAFRRQIYAPHERGVER